MKKIFALFSFVFFFFSFISFSYSTVEVFSNYDTILTVNSDNTINVNKSLTLKNVYDVGIVPGQIEFKIGRGIDGSIDNLEVDNLSAYDSFGNEIKTQIRRTSDYTVIILDIYYPLLPGFEYEFDLFYKISYKPGGIFFKSLQIPLRESTIPIKGGEFKVVLPENYYFTYVESEGKNASVNKNIAIWDIEDDLPKSVIFEYSYLPISVGSLKGSYVFWIMINIILLGILVIEVRKEINKVKSKVKGD